MPSLELAHYRGFNGELHGSVVAHPTEFGKYIYYAGSLLCIGDEMSSAPHRQLKGHDAAITAMAVSSNGKLIATACKGANADVILWDSASGNILTRFQEHDNAVTGLCFSPDDKVLASVGADKRLFCIDVSTGKIISHGQLASSDVYAVASSPVHGPCYYFATGSSSEMSLWTLDPYKGWLHEDRVLLGAVKRSYTCLTFSPDGNWLYAGTRSGDVVTVNVVRKNVQMVHPLCSISVGAIVHAAGNSGQLLFGGGDGSMGFFTHDNMRVSVPVAGAIPGEVTSLSYTANGVDLLVGSANGGIFRVTPDQGTLLVQQSQRAPLRGVCFAPGGSDCMASCSGHNNGSIAIWELAGGTAQVRTYVTESRLLAGVQAVELSPEFMLSGWSDGHLRCHDYSGNKLWEIPHAHDLARSYGCTALRLSHRSPFFVTGGAGGEIRVWDLSSRKLFSSMVQHTGRINDLAVLQDDVHLVAAGEDKIWSLWDLYHCKSKGEYRHQSQIAVRGLAVTPDQRSLITVGYGDRINIWDIDRSPQPARYIQGPHHETNSVAVSPDGRYFATGGADALVRLWDYSTLKCCGEFSGHSSTINRIRWSDDGKMVASVAEDGTLCLWDVKL